jgi:hypothetical protein
MGFIAGYTADGMPYGSFIDEDCFAVTKAYRH